jgi:hypothetical protein
MEAHSSLISDSLGLDLSGTGQSLGGLGTGREELVNYSMDLSDDKEDESVSLISSSCILHHFMLMFKSFGNRKSVACFQFACGKPLYLHYFACPCGIT